MADDTTKLEDTVISAESGMRRGLIWEKFDAGIGLSNSELDVLIGEAEYALEYLSMRPAYKLVYDDTVRVLEQLRTYRKQRS